MRTRFVKGFIPPDEKWLRMKEIWDVCVASDIDPPDEVYEFFDGEEPDPEGMEVEIAHKPWGDMDKDGVSIDVDKLPKNVKTILVYDTY